VGVRVQVGYVIVFTVSVLGLFAVAVSEADAYTVPSSLAAERFAALCPPRPADEPAAKEPEAAALWTEQSASDECVRVHGENDARGVHDAALLHELGYFAVGAIAGLFFFGRVVGFFSP
jgi:hypothetical protein